MTRKVYAVFENTCDANDPFTPPLATGFIGVFSSKKRATDAMKQAMLKLGMPDDWYQNDMTYAIPVDENGHMVDCTKDPYACKFWMEFRCIQTEFNKTLTEVF